MLPDVLGLVRLGKIDQFRFNREQLDDKKQACQKHCFFTLKHNLACCYTDARVIKWENVKRGGVRSFED